MLPQCEVTLRNHMSRLAPCLLAALAFVPRSNVSAQEAPTQAGALALDAPVPMDPAVRIGKLPNGLTYYIQRHTEPAKRAELRLVVKAGALHEDDDQLGMAHLVEHMGFNGTTHFRKNDLIDYLRSIGVRFGADLNASTSTDATIYLLQIPTDSARLLEQGIVVLADWANGMTFDSTEVANERGVVVEEWRGAQGVGFRTRSKLAPVMYKGSRYAERNVIGSEQTIMSATPALLKRYYADWYRPDLQAVIVVGEVDVDSVEAHIRRNFSPIEARPKPRPHPSAEIPDNKAPLIAIASDKEAGGTSVVVSFKLPRRKALTAREYRQRLVEGFATAMLRARLGEITRNPDAPFLGASVSRGGFTRSKESFTLSVGAKDGGAARALEAVVTEVRRAQQFGFLQSELNRMKTNALRGMEMSYAEREKRRSSGIAGSYIANFIDDLPIPSVEYGYRLGQQVVPTITLDEVNGLISGWVTAENRVITAVVPEKAGVAIPTEGELLAALERGWTAAVPAYTENVAEGPLVPSLPAAGRVTGGRTRADVGITEWKLSNGARVIIKPTDFRKDEIMFAAYSFGGSSLLPDADVFNAQFAGSVVATSGVGAFNSVDLGKRLAGKAASVSPYVAGVIEGMRGSASPKDLETMFQLMHLYFTAPRYDSSAVEAMMGRQRESLSHRGATPESHFADTIWVTMGSSHPRDRILTLDRLAEVNPKRAFALYKERFADAGDFTFIFVGTVDTAALKPLVEKYVASLPSTGSRERWRDVGITAPKGRVEKFVRRGSEPKSLTRVIFTGDFPYADSSTFQLQALMDVLQARLIETLREGMSGTYSPGIGGYGVSMPRRQYRITLSFGSSPERADTLYRTALALIDSLKRHGPTQAEVDKVREAMLRSRELAVKQNGFWMGSILGRDQTGEDIATLLGPWDEMIRKLSPAQVQQAARTYFTMENVARFVLLPDTARVP